MKRLVSLFALAALTVLGGCKDAAPAGTTQGVESSFVHAGTDVVIKSVRTVATGDQVAGSNDEYYIVAFTFTNNLGHQLTPQINHFVLEDVDRKRYFGAESGSAALVGISNYTDTLKAGDSHDYTVGFRVPVNTYATLLYDPTF